MHPSKGTLRPKVRRPMAWDSTKSAPSAQQPEPSTQCPIPGGYRRAETRHHRIASRPAARGRAATRHDRRDPPSPLRTARNNRMPPTQSPLATAHRAQKLDTIESITRIWLRTARRNQTPSRAILHAIRRTDTSSFRIVYPGKQRAQPCYSVVGHDKSAQKQNGVSSDTPLRSWPLSRRSGRFPALPYPPLRPIAFYADPQNACCVIGGCQSRKPCPNVVSYGRF